MARYRDAYDPQCEAELLIRAAGDFVQASEDLRPRVLESARLAQGEMRMRQWIRRASAFAILLTAGTAAAGRQLEISAAQPGSALAAAEVRSVYLTAESNAAQCGGIAWGMVEAFTDLRRRQSEALGASL